MATNPHFQHFDATNEQYLVQDLIIESIKIYGHDVYYMPRTLVNEDTLYSEDTISAFNDAYVVEMYIKNVDGFEGEGDFMSRFGLEIRDQITFSVAQRTFKNLLLDSTYDRPKEGDIIYFPLTKKVFEIRFVEHESVFYQTGALQTYDLVCELFQYEDQAIDTGIEDIDKIEREESYSIDVVLDSGTGTYTTGETVYQGTNLASANTTAEVVSWTLSSKTLRVMNLVGTFNTTYNVVGGSSSASYSFTSTDYQQDKQDTTSDSYKLEIEADAVLDFTESNPFSEGNI
jgi:hypothetical protein